MLRDARRFDEDTEYVPTFASARVPAAATPVAGAVSIPAERYGQGRKSSLFAIIVTVLMHVALIAAAFLIRNHTIQKREAKLTVVNLTPAPPPPASTPETPKPQQQQVMVPRPLVQTPIQTPVLIQTTPDPVPQPVPPTVAVANPSPPAPPAPPSIVQASDLGSRMVAGKAPNYPMDSRRKHEQGTVVLTLTLGYDGRVADIAVSHSSGFDRLDQAALGAVRKWRWEPTLRSGQPVMVRGVVEIPFVLQG